jgi:hypothetical protein
MGSLGLACGCLSRGPKVSENGISYHGSDSDNSRSLELQELQSLQSHLGEASKAAVLCKRNSLKEIARDSAWRSSLVAPLVGRDWRNMPEEQRLPPA